MSSDTTKTLEAIANGRLLAITAIVILAMLGGSTQLFVLIWNRQPFEDLSAQPGGLLGAFIIFVGGAVLHEVLHAIVWKTLAHVPWSNLSLQRNRRKLGIIVKLNMPVRASVYRVGLVLPTIIMGIGPILIGLVQGAGLLVLWGGVFLFECFSDLAIFLAIRKVPLTALVVEKAGRLGCQIVLHAQAA
jgi:hypothetical protein